jgi:hypothetical protein
MTSPKFVNRQKIVKQPFRFNSAPYFIRTRTAKCELLSIENGGPLRGGRQDRQEAKEKMVLLAIFTLLSAIALSKQLMIFLATRAG